MSVLTKSLIALSLGLGLSSLTQAASSIDLAYQQTLGVSLWTTSTSGFNTGGMQFTSTSGQSFEAFCAEVQQDHARVSDGFKPYAVASFDGRQGRLLQGLFSSSYADVKTDLQRAAFQTAVWEVLNETPTNSLNVSFESGSFYFKDFSVSAPDGELEAFENLANSYLSAGEAYSGAPKYQVLWLRNGQHQDLVTASAVPEPASYALMALGLALVGAASRRRNKR